METKLTLSLDQEVIAKAKTYAKLQKTSLSRLVENYFYLLTLAESAGKTTKPKVSPITDKLLGSVPVQEINQEKLKTDYLMEKYINV